MRGIRMKKSAYFLLFIFILCHSNIFAQPELDTSFSGDGMYSQGTTFTFLPVDTVIQPDNKPISISNCINTSTGVYQFCFIRLTEDGLLDPTFDGSFPISEPGAALFAIPGSDTQAAGAGRGLALLADGKIIAVGSATFSGVESPVMIRLNTNGTLDSTFGTNGVLSYQVSGRFSKVSIQPDGKIVTVGISQDSQMVARFLPDGTPDNSFGINGFKIFPMAGMVAKGLTIDLQADGKIVLGGSIAPTSTPSNTSYFLTRVNSDGALDTTFDDDGYKTIALTPAGNYAIVSVAVKPDGRIAALGNKNNLYQLNPNGSFDTGFDNDGARSALSGISDSNKLLVSASGRITVAGFPTFIGGNFPMVYRINRYLSNGSPDAGFSGDGFLEINIPNVTYDAADTVAFDKQGRLFIGGRQWQGGPTPPWQYCQYSAARLLAPPAQNVGFAGKVVKSDGKPVLNAFITLKLGSEVVGVGRTNPFGYFHFKNIQSNQTYTLSTYAKSLNFTDRSVLVDDEIVNYLIVGEQLPTLIQNDK